MECSFENVETTLLEVVAGLLVLDKDNNQIIMFSDNTTLKDLQNNEVVVETKQGSYKITIDSYGS